MAAELTWDRVGSTTRSVYEAALDGQS
jgi:hypothetical protein